MSTIHNEKKKTCQLCNCTTNTTTDVVFFGNWMQRNNLTVHYYCLLLSTHLPQEGADCAGILGFLTRDIRNEIRAAGNRKCCFCSKSQATISCHGCKDYFHLVCGHRNYCRFEFDGEFRSYCGDCVPLDEYELSVLKNPPSSELRCYICKDTMGNYSPIKWIYSKCCKNGYVHQVCMQKYALAAGYYLKCIWCKGNRFREQIRYQGIFVPDRDAQWERRKGAYKDLHRGHNRCDMDKCNCPRGRDYNSSKWSLINCSLCGSVGTHNPLCLPGYEKSKTPVKDFKCATCAGTEKEISNHDQSKTSISGLQTFKDSIDFSVYITKRKNMQEDAKIDETINFSDESQSSASSCITVVRRSTLPPAVEKLANQQSSTQFSRMPPPPVPESIEIHSQSPIPTCLQSSIISENQQSISNLCIQNPPIALVAENVETQILEIENEASSSASPIVSSSSQETEGSIATFEMFLFDENLTNCSGTCTVRIDLNSPRFSGKTLEEIQASEGLITEEDIIEESNSIGIFEDINRIIAEFNA